MRQFFFDTEFMEEGGRVELLSIGIVRRDDEGEAMIYLVNDDADLSRANAFVQENVLPYLDQEKRGVQVQRLSMEGVAKSIEGFLPPRDMLSKWEAWAYYADYDWVAFCSLWGQMVNLPKQMPFLCMDVKQLAIHKGLERSHLPQDDVDEHHALVDALWTMRAYDRCMEAGRE